MKLVLLIILAAIIYSLGSGLYFLYRDQEGSSRVLKALKVRVALSILLVLLLVLSYSFGWISPNA